MIFSVEDGCFSYGSTRQILRGISFSTSGGEVMAVLGPNGAGKTTMLRCMMGLLVWKSGASYIDRKNIAHFGQRELWRQMAYVPQAKAGNFAYRVEDIVLMGRSAHIGATSQPSAQDREIAAEAMRCVSIEHLRNEFGNRLSGGELQMVLIARALATEPSLLVLDEPESNLDFRNQLIVLETIRSLAAEKGICCIFNTHYPAHALKISGRSLLLSREGTATFGRTEEVVSRENMEQVFHVDVHIEKIERRGYSFKSVTALSVIQ